MRVGNDLDGVGHVFGDTVRAWLIHTGRGHLWKSGPNKKPYWDFFKDWGWTVKQFVEECNAAADAGILFDGPIREGYAEGIAAIAGMGHEIIIHTDRPFGTTPEVSEKITVAWLEKHGIEYDELWFGADKTASKCDTFIEDKLENYDALTSAGTKTFLLNRPWNEVEGGDARTRINHYSEYVDAVRQISEQGYADLSFA